MSAVRPLSRSEERAFRLARLGAVETMPYFARALFALQPVAHEGSGTFGVDRHWRLYLDPARLLGADAWSSADQSGVLLHEVGHLIRDHAGRSDQLAQPYHHRLWNIAGDAEINDDLLAAGVPLPASAVTPAALDQPDNELAETYYASLHDPAAGTPDPSDGEGCGSGSGARPTPGEMPGDDPATATVPVVSPADADVIRRHVATEVAVAAGRGTVPAGLSRWAAATLAPPTVPWTRVLRASVRRAVLAVAGRTDYTYSRPSRRRLAGIVLPAMRGTRVNVAVVIDTSGSMGLPDLTAAVSELRGVLSSTHVSKENLRVMSCDAAASTAQPVRSLAALDLTGGGGTDMRIGIRSALALRPRTHVVIVLTDGDTPWPTDPLPGTTLICAVISQRPPRGTPTWATTVHIPPAHT